MSLENTIPKLDWELFDKKDDGTAVYTAFHSLDDCSIEGRIFESSAEELCFDITVSNLKTGVWASRGGVQKNMSDLKSQAQRTLLLLWKYRNDTAW